MSEISLNAADLKPEDFEHVDVQREVHGISRPSLSYWQDAWIRLQANRRSYISLYIVLALLLFTIAGPWVWTVDPASQDLDQISRPPGLNSRAEIVPPYVPWTGVTATLHELPDDDQSTPTQTAPIELRLAEEATTQSVRLMWDPVPGASAYRVYRNIVKPGRARDLGIPLADILNPARVSFEDLLDLTPRTFYYSVVALNDDAEEYPGYASLKVNAKRVITLSEARERGLVDTTEEIKTGDSINLQAHPFGTDYLGRDMLARLMFGARVSLFIGIFAPVFYVLIGIIYGSTAGFLGGKMDQVLMRFADFVVALPFLLFMILFKIAFGIGPGESGIGPMLIAMVLLLWPATARLVRGQILQIREEGYISASQLLGARTPYLIMRHMIPNTMGVILVTLTFAVPSAIFTEAFLSFIGMGVAPPTPSWGSMCNDGLKTMLTHPHELIFPALFISITVLAFNLLGDGLRDALDARMRSRE